MNDPNESILLTESGHRIGEIVLADNTSVVQPPDEDLIQENRDQLLRSQASEMTGELNADKAIATLYPGYGDSDLRRKALELFVVGGKSLDEIAAEVSVPARTVSMWSYIGGWADLLTKELSARQRQSVLELSRLRASRRLTIMKEQLDQAKELRDTAMRKLRDDETSVKSATEAWAAASKIEHTVTGLSEAGAVAGLDGSDDSEKKEQGKTPLVMVFQGGLPPIRKVNQ